MEFLIFAYKPSEALTRRMNVNLTVARSKKASGRTSMHYAARNGSLDAAHQLHAWGADCNARAKHGVTPFQLALFQNQRAMAAWLLAVTPNALELLVETNEFGCNAAHWLSICPPGPRSGPNGIDLIATAEWLDEQQHLHPSCHDAVSPVNLFTAVQKQGHSAFHKAAWMGHTALVQYLHERFDIWDDGPDRAGNFACVLAEMGRHDETATYIRQHCSRSARDSCAILGLELDDKDDLDRVRRAYLQRARETHPDRCRTPLRLHQEHSFDAVCRAYHHLTVEQGRGQQCNPSHTIQLLLPPSLTDASHMSDTTNGRHDCFPARLLAVLHEYGSAGLDVSNLRKKWRQVWHTDLPISSGSLTTWLRTHVGDVVDVRLDDKGCHRLHAKLNV